MCSVQITLNPIEAFNILKDQKILHVHGSPHFRKALSGNPPPCLQGNPTFSLPLGWWPTSSHCVSSHLHCWDWGRPPDVRLPCGPSGLLNCCGPVLPRSRCFRFWTVFSGLGLLPFALIPCLTSCALGGFVSFLLLFLLYILDYV